MAKLKDIGMGALDSAIGQGMGMVFGGMQDRRQVRQQQKLQDQQIKGQKDMANYNQQLAMKTWEETNYKAQVEQMKKAGLNVGLMYGGGGAGGGTVASGGGGSVTGATASDPNSGTGMGMQIASQIALMNAQKENIEADTANKKAGTGKATAETANTEFGNKVNELITPETKAEKYKWEADQSALISEKLNAEWEAFKQGAFNGKAFDDPNSPIAKAQKAGYEQAVTEGLKAKESKDLVKAQKEVEQFKAGLAREGIDPNSPWWVKIIGDLLSKIGLSPISGVKGLMK